MPPCLTIVAGLRGGRNEGSISSFRDLSKDSQGGKIVRLTLISYVLTLGILGLLVQAECARGQEPRHQVTAWDSLVNAGAIPPDLTPLEREVLTLLTAEQVERYARGADASSIVLINGESLEMFLVKRGLLGFDLSWYSVDSGSAAMTGVNFRLTGTAGQTDAGSMTGGNFSLVGGFLAASILPTAMPCTGGELIFCNGFESGDLQAWSFIVSQ